MRYIESLKHQAETLHGEKIAFSFTGQKTGLTDGKNASAVFDIGGYCISVFDVYREEEKDILLERHIQGSPSASYADSGDGVQISLSFGINGLNECGYRFCIPSMIYSNKKEEAKRVRHSYMEDRLTGPMVLAYNESTGEYISFTKEKPSRYVKEMIRNIGDTRYLHEVHAVSIGYSVRDDDSVWFESSWPYAEGDKSSALSADERPAAAYYPLDGREFSVEMSFRIHEGKNESFAAACYETYEHLAKVMETLGEDIICLPCTKKESIDYRMESLGKSYREFAPDGAGFFFHFDPKFGYGSRPSGFSTCYDTIPHNSYIHILEYGFTGRQINAAFVMASQKGGEWIERGKKVIDFFLSKCQLENGWLYSLYDLNTEAPFFSFGDPDAPKLHYISRTNQKGNYLRTMTEPMNDLLDCYNWYKSIGEIREDWQESVLRYADFLIKYQNLDGSWFRAYCPDGTGTDAIDRPDLTSAEAQKGQKSVTSIPIVFLTNVCRMLKCEGKDSTLYENAARRAGEYVLGDMVREEHYQGATLDNPNQVDKEAAQYVMAGLTQLYLLTGEKKYLDGAENAAFMFTTWNYIWNAPMQKGTILFDKGFKTKGMGAINSVWGGGAVDIYSLFHIRELYIVGKLRNHPLMCEMAEWISVATEQIVSRPDDTMGFTDIGMQPEGFGVCPQGIDEGMIHKGDIWGTLGWIYSAGTYGILNYLHTKEEMA